MLGYAHAHLNSACKVVTNSMRGSASVLGPIVDECTIVFCLEDVMKDSSVDKVWARRPASVLVFA